MKNLKPIAFIIVVVVLTAITSYPQRKFNGVVTKVLDGKTCVIAVPGGEITAVLQYIDIPEPEQKLRDTVKDHLSRLVLDKSVEFVPRTVIFDRTMGQLFVSGVDVSQQMLRDGAAWLVPADSSFQNAAEYDGYKENEAHAKKERRGVWGVDNLLPPWEFRAEQERLAAQRQREEIDRVRREAAAVRPGTRALQNRAPSRMSYFSADTDLFVDPFEEDKYDKSIGYGGLRSRFDSKRNMTTVSTPTIILDMPTSGWMTKLNARFYFFHEGPYANNDRKLYAIGLVGVSKSRKLSNATRLTVYADGRAYDLGKAMYFSSKVEGPDANGEVAEATFYKITDAQIAKFAAAKTLKIQLGGYRGAIASESYEYIRNLYNSTSN